MPAVLLAAAEAFVKRACALNSETTPPEVPPSAPAASGARLSDDGVHMLSLFLQCVPTRGQSTEFFAPLATPCCALLRTCRLLPTRDGFLASPSEVVLWREVEHDDASRLTEPLLRSSVGLVPLHPLLRMPEALADELGVRKVDARLLCEVLDALTSQAHELDATWLSWAFEQLQRDVHLSPLLPKLRGMPLIPLIGGERSSTTVAPIYELDDGKLASQLSSLSLLKSLGTLRLVEPRFLRTIHERRDARCLLARLKVNKLSAAELVMGHVVPALGSRSTPVEALPSLLAFARLQAITHASLAAELPKALLRSGARLLSSRGVIFTLQMVGDVPMALCERGTALQLGHAFCDPAQDAFPTRDLDGWPTVSEQHLCLEGVGEGSAVEGSAVEGSAVEGSAAPDLVGWRAFFISLGVDSFPVCLPAARTDRMETRLDDPGEALAAEVAGAEEDEHGGLVTDWVSPALDALLADLAERADLEGLARLLALLLERWPALQARGVLPRATHPANPASSRVLQSLRNSRWLASSDGALHQPSELWLPNDDILAVLGSTVPYVREDLPAEVASALGVQVALEPERLLGLLEEWAAASEAGTHWANPAAMTPLYDWLATCSAASDAEWLQRLSELRILWVPRGGTCMTTLTPDGCSPGDFCMARQCVWKDTTELLDPLATGEDQRGSAAGSAAVQLTSGVHCRVLSRWYSSAHESTFVRLGVAPQPPLEAYVAILLAAAALGELSAEVLACTLRVFALLGSWARTDAAAANELRDGVHGLPLPTASGVWSQPEEVYCYLRASQAAEWTELTLRHAVLVPDIPDDGLDGHVEAFLASVIGLQPLQACVHEGIDMTAMPPVEHMQRAATSAQLVALAAVVQRLTATPMCNAEEREELRQLLCGLRLHKASSLDCFVQVSAFGNVLERRALDSSRCRAFLWKPPKRSDADAAADKPSGYQFVRVSSAPPVVTRQPGVLFTTPDAQPRDLIVQVCKVLPATLQASASLSLFPVLHHVWEWRTPTSALAALLCGDQLGLHDVPPLPVGETLWLETEPDVSAAQATEDAGGPLALIAQDLVQAQAREQRNLVAGGDMEGLSPDLLVAASAADGQLDAVLAKAISSREAARALHQSRALPSSSAMDSRAEMPPARTTSSLTTPPPPPPTTSDVGVAAGDGQEAAGAGSTLQVASGDVSAPPAQEAGRGDDGRRPPPPTSAHGEPTAWRGLPPLPLPPPLPRRPKRPRANEARAEPTGTTVPMLADAPSMPSALIEPTCTALSPEILALPALNEIDRGARRRRKWPATLHTLKPVVDGAAYARAQGRPPHK